MTGAMEKDDRTLRSWLLERVEGTLKEPKGCLARPFIDPGSVYDGNLWDWDSFWAEYGLLNLLNPDGSLGGDGQGGDRAGGHGGRFPASGRAWLDYARGGVENFFDHQEPDGYIPMMVEAKDAVPYLIRKHREGALLNMHKPFLARRIALISGFTGDYAWAQGRADGLALYFRRYKADYFKAECGLYVWADDVMIGMDNDPASFGRPRFSTANVFLNSFMVAELRAASVLMTRWGRAAEGVSYAAEADALAAAVRRECWDPRDRFFYSVDVDVRTRPYDWFHVGLGVFWKTLPIKIRAWSGFLPLWAGIAGAEEAEALADLHARDERVFAAPYGITSLGMDERMFDLSATNNPSNWLGPIWIVAQYCVFRGLLRYGYRAAAEDLCAKTLRLLARDLERTGTLHEYYDPFTGDPVMNGGFINWNILALNMADELRGKAPMESFIA